MRKRAVAIFIALAASTGTAAALGSDGHEEPAGVAGPGAAPATASLEQRDAHDPHLVVDSTPAGGGVAYSVVGEQPFPPEVDTVEEAKAYLFNRHGPVGPIPEALPADGEPSE